jgi:hypothetical protein
VASSDQSYFSLMVLLDVNGPSLGHGCVFEVFSRRSHRKNKTGKKHTQKSVELATGQKKSK